MPFLLLGLVGVAWAGFSLITGRGYYKGCPPGGYVRDEQPFHFWAATLVILGIGVFLILVSLGVVPVPGR
jgi:hypothetical protein